MFDLRLPVGLLLTILGVLLAGSGSSRQRISIGGPSAST